MSPTNYNPEKTSEKSVNKVYPHYGINIFNPDPKKPETQTGYEKKGGKRKSRKQKISLRRKSRKARKSQKKRR